MTSFAKLGFHVSKTDGLTFLSGVKISTGECADLASIAYPRTFSQVSGLKLRLIAIHMKGYHHEQRQCHP